MKEGKHILCPKCGKTFVNPKWFQKHGCYSTFYREGHILTLSNSLTPREIREAVGEQEVVTKKITDIELEHLSQAGVPDKVIAESFEMSREVVSQRRIKLELIAQNEGPHGRLVTSAQFARSYKGRLEHGRKRKS